MRNGLQKVAGGSLLRDAKKQTAATKARSRDPRTHQHKLEKRRWGRVWSKGCGSKGSLGSEGKEFGFDVFNKGYLL